MRRPTPSPATRPPRRWAATFAVLAAAWCAVNILGCLPPPIDGVEDEGELALLVDFDRMIPTGTTVAVARTAGENATFDVREVYKSSLDPSAELFYYWYLDWAPDSGIGPVGSLLQREVFNYQACTTDLDPADEFGVRPDTRNLTLVVSTEPLVEPTNAYLGSAEGSATLDRTWLIDFVGVCLVQQ